MTPFEIDILMWYHVRTVDHECVNNPPPIWKETVDKFLEEGLLLFGSKEDSTMYVIAPRGEAYCRSLCRVPLPQQQWVTIWPEEKS